MIARLFTAVLLSAFPAAASAAETLSVRAGEHGEYSRLVIPGAPDDWSIATSERKVEITFPQKGLAFELSDILEKRKAHRVLSARILDTEDSRSLVLSLTCDCPVRTSKSNGDSIVIDIFSETPVALSENEAAQPSQTISNEARKDASVTPESMRAARDRMIALLAEARHQGVIQLKSDETRDDEPQTARAATPVTQASHSPDPVQESPAPAAPSVEAGPLAAPAQDADGPPQPLLAADQTETRNCVDPTLFDEPKDEEERLDYSAITNLRRQFDLSNDEEERRDIAATLALAYIHIGFFEEASAIASAQRQDDDPNLTIIGALADAAAGDNSRAARTLSSYRQCGALTEAAYAAVAPLDDDNAPAMGSSHISALKALAGPLRAPLSEALGLRALEANDTTIAKAFYDVAKQARGRERSPALAILENALAQEMAETEETDNAGNTAEPNLSAQPVITEELKAIAQTPGPLQAKALAILAEDYERRADAAYEGLLDDIASQSNRRSASLSEARASFTGAKALVSAGRLREGVTVLETAARSAPGARSASETLARSFIMNALLEDDETRLEAVAAFFEHRDFLEDRNNGDLNIAVARELAAYGANALVDDALNGTPSAWRAQADAIKALSHLNSGDAQGALDIAARGQPSNDLAVVAVSAHERLNDRAGVIAAIRSGMRNSAADSEFTKAAWRTSDWALAVEAFSKTPKDKQNVEAAKRASLAALNNGADAPPSAALEALADKPDALNALSHMFKKAPSVNIRAIDLLADFSTGVAREADFMETGLGAGGD